MFIFESSLKILLLHSQLREKSVNESMSLRAQSRAPADLPASLGAKTMLPPPIATTSSATNATNNNGDDEDWETEEENAVRYLDFEILVFSVVS